MTNFTLPALPGALDTVYHVDALALLAALPDASVSAVITDLPYGTTACSWDEIIPFEPMWAGVKRVLKPRGVFVTTASQPFTSKLVMSNPKWFRYEWIWDKGKGSNYQLANIMPMKSHENVLVFAASSTTFFPQFWYSTPYKTKEGKRANPIQGLIVSTASTYRTSSISDDGKRYPVSVLRHERDNDRLHPTQKPVALYRYLVRTYTQPGDLVLDFCCGSGTTALAAREEGRRFIAGDTSADYVAIANKRLSQPYTPSFMALLDAAQSPEPSATEAAA